MSDIMTYYTEHGRMTQVDELKNMITDIPRDIGGIVKIVQGILVHQAWASKYGVEITEERKAETYIRSFEEKLRFLNDYGYEHINDIIDHKNKMFAICRDFAVVATALCRDVNIPARARCGFATYFSEGLYIDHWLMEYWHEDEKRWVMVDPQIDDVQKPHLVGDLNPLDVSPEHFITGDKAWAMCRAGKVDPMKFGIFQWWGYTYLKCNLLLDANSLLKTPMHPWDSWCGYKSLDIDQWTEQDYMVMDELAEKIALVNNDYQTLRDFVESNEKIKVPEDLTLVDK